MKLSKVKSILVTATTVAFRLENGTKVPAHFHVTEIGIITKDFIDCGGKVRREKVANFQLWNANDFDHRLKPKKLLNIIALCENRLGMEDLEIEVEYQSDTIGKYDLGHDGENFLLLSKKTVCLANDACGITVEQEKLQITEETCCVPGGGCC